MTRTWYAVRLGLTRGLIEFRQGLTNPQDLWFYLAFPAMFLTPLWFLRDNEVPGTDLPVATLAIPGVAGMLVAYGGLISPGAGLASEREDGTLLRAKALPRGMETYLAGITLRTNLEAVTMAALVLVPAMLLFDGVAPAGINGWLTVLWVLVLGLLATVPLGLVVGSLASSPRTVGGMGFLCTGALVAISGIFYPITALAGWLQVIGQIFPIYWLGLGMRSAFLPDSALAVEIGRSWRTWETVGVLGVWALVGLLLAPRVLRRMARRESGADMAARRQAAMQRLV